MQESSVSSGEDAQASADTSWVDAYSNGRKAEADYVAAFKKAAAYNATHPPRHGGFMASMHPIVDLQQATPANQANDQANLPPPPDMLPIYIAGTILLVVLASLRWWLPVLRRRLVATRRQPEILIVAGLGLAAFDWRVMPGLIEDRAISFDPYGRAHAAGWFMMSALSIALLGLYWKMRGPRDHK